MKSDVAVERVNKNRLRWTYDYCGLRTTTLFHDILILPQSCQQVKEDNLPPHWGSNPRTSADCAFWEISAINKICSRVTQ